MALIDLMDWGWRPDGTDAVEMPSPEMADADDLRVARVLEEQRDGFRLITESGYRRARLRGRALYETDDAMERPAVGDWVRAEVSDPEHAFIHEVLPRRTQLVRKVAGRAVRPQVVAANVDTVFLMTSLNQDLEPRRIERYLAVIWDSGAQPVLLLSKSDLCADAESAADLLGGVALGVPLHVLSVHAGRGVEAVRGYLQPGRTVALLGSSGVGKSTLLNHLAGEDLQAVRTIRSSDDRGCHTTTARRLVRLPDGALLLDTPGMRELGLWDAEEGIDEAFADVTGLASRCRFRDCQHADEPGCAVHAAIEDGTLEAERYDAWRKLQRELAFIRRKQSQQAALAGKREFRRLGKVYRRAAKERKRRRGE